LGASLRGRFRPKIDKKTQLKNQNQVVGPILGFLVGRNRRFLRKCARWSGKLYDNILQQEQVYWDADMAIDNIEDDAVAEVEQTICSAS
jgi:hypothetical protein